VLAALARDRADQAARHEKIWGKPAIRFSKAATERQRKALARISRDREISCGSPEGGFPTPPSDSGLAFTRSRCVRSSVAP
jgi:hypothetical protein